MTPVRLRLAVIALVTLAGARRRARHPPDTGLEREYVPREPAAQGPRPAAGLRPARLERDADPLGRSRRQGRSRHVPRQPMPRRVPDRRLDDRRGTPPAFGRAAKERRGHRDLLEDPARNGHAEAGRVASYDSITCWAGWFRCPARLPRCGRSGRSSTSRPPSTRVSTTSIPPRFASSTVPGSGCRRSPAAPT